MTDLGSECQSKKEGALHRFCFSCPLFVLVACLFGLGVDAADFSKKKKDKTIGGGGREKESKPRAGSF